MCNLCRYARFSQAQSQILLAKVPQKYLCKELQRAETTSVYISESFPIYGMYFMIMGWQQKVDSPHCEKRGI